MALDDVLFFFGQVKHRFGVVARNARVLEAVPVGDVAAVVPVVQVKIVQERALYKADFVGVGAQVDVQPERNAGDAHTVLVGRDAAVLDELLHFHRVRVIRDAF